MRNENIIQELKDQSTWRLFGLGLITLGVYWAHYIKRQTNRINNRLDVETAISNGFIQSFLIFSYLSAAWLIPVVMVEEGHVVDIIGRVLNDIWIIMIVMWSFKARNRINTLCAFSKDGKEWFNGFWTFWFVTSYINYKVNVLNESQNLPQ